MKKAHGFTLIEVLIAMAVFAVAAMTVLNSTSQYMNTLKVLEEKIFASMVANNQLALLVLEEKVPTSVTNGKSKLAGRTWYWTVQPTITTDHTLKVVELIVWQHEDKRNSIVSVKMYVPAD
ncbi:type II secretion system minor pseudopilin GspI [Candidatus Enterovibrio altilux]|uniref:Type II secretion system protein I n=1 Tax=Candidatus Enterovibrio altilux TaxID=1927128 RepID=A0A291B923_9GAMM|nr:type II secretion system minor pseudopilin GspI [Candidatus Enterovibrio luxaltus]ATF09482.1 General secretion pathway protein I [Candidatus Enterovibrio luxaltus]